MMRGATSLCSLVLAMLFLPGGTARAEATRRAPYPLKQAWGSAVRFLRVDAGHKIEERDQEAGYIIFTVKEEGKTFPGSVQIVPIIDDLKRQGVKITLRIEDRPVYMESGLLERLSQKMRADHGEPAPPPREKPKPEPAPDKKTEAKQQ